jgi:hypothetical protein
VSIKARVERAAERAGITVTVESRTPGDWVVCMHAPDGYYFDYCNAHVARQRAGTAGEMWQRAYSVIKYSLWPCVPDNHCEGAQVTESNQSPPKVGYNGGRR